MSDTKNTPEELDEEIIDLTDIIERGAPEASGAAPGKAAQEQADLSNQLNDLGRGKAVAPSAADSDIDALLDEIDSGVSAAPAGAVPDATGHPVDPNEELDMPQMKEVDSLLESLDMPPQPDAGAAAPAAEAQGEDLDAMLSELLTGAPAAAAPAAPAPAAAPPAPAKPTAPATAEDLLNDLDSVLGTPAAPAAPAAAPAAAEAPEVPDVAAAPDMPEMPEVAAAPAAAEAPEIPDVAAAPAAPDMPDMPEAPAVDMHPDMSVVDAMANLPADAVPVPDIMPEAPGEDVPDSSPADVADDAQSWREPLPGAEVADMPAPLTAAPDAAQGAALPLQSLADALNQPESPVHVAFATMMRQAVADALPASPPQDTGALDDLGGQVAALDARVQSGSADTQALAERLDTLDARTAETGERMAALEARLEELAASPVVTGETGETGETDTAALDALREQNAALEARVQELEARLAALGEGTPLPAAGGAVTQQDLDEVAKGQISLEDRLTTAEARLEQLHKAIEQEAAKAASTIIREEIAHLLAE